MSLRVVFNFDKLNWYFKKFKINIYFKQVLLIEELVQITKNTKELDKILIIFKNSDKLNEIIIYFFQKNTNFIYIINFNG